MDNSYFLYFPKTSLPRKCFSICFFSCSNCSKRFDFFSNFSFVSFNSFCSSLILSPRFVFSSYAFFSFALIFDFSSYVLCSFALISYFSAYVLCSFALISDFSAYVFFNSSDTFFLSTSSIFIKEAIPVSKYNGLPFSPKNSSFSFSGTFK